jgi:hypothetical protein
MSRYASAMAAHIYTTLKDNRVPLGLVDVWFGDQNLLPQTPAACVIMSEWDRMLVGEPRRVDQTTNVFVVIYHNAVQDTQANELEVNQLAERVAKFIDDDSTCGGLVIHSFVTRYEPGYRTLGQNNKYRSTRLTWTGLSRFSLNVEP